MVRLFLPLFLGIALIGLTTGRARACDPTGVGADSPDEIKTFVASVYEAVNSGNTASLEPLIQFPVTIHSRPGEGHVARKLTIANAAEFRKRAPEILTESFRKSFLKNPPADLICRTGQVGMANGAIWAARTDRLLITSINAPDYNPPDLKTATIFECRTKDHLVRIDRPEQKLRYRSWSKDKSPDSKPALVIDGGQEHVEGTGVCAASFWTFRNGAFVYEVGEDKCGADSDSTRVGTLELSKDGKAVKRWDCL